MSPEESAGYAKSLKDNPLLKVIITDMIDSVNDGLLLADLADTKELQGLAALLQGIGSFASQLDDRIDDAKVKAHNDRDTVT